MAQKHLSELLLAAPEIQPRVPRRTLSPQAAQAFQTSVKADAVLATLAVRFSVCACNCWWQVGCIRTRLDNERVEYLEGGIILRMPITPTPDTIKKTPAAGAEKKRG